MQPPGRVQQFVAPAEQDDRSAGDPAHLGQPPGLVGPVIDAQHGHHRAEGAVSERERFGNRAHRRRGVLRALGDHDRRWLDGHDRPVPRLVRPGARPHVQHAVRVADRRGQRRSDLRLLAQAAGVPGPIRSYTCKYDISRVCHVAPFPARTGGQSVIPAPPAAIHASFPPRQPAPRNRRLPPHTRESSRHDRGLDAPQCLLVWHGQADPKIRMKKPHCMILSYALVVQMSIRF